MLGTSFRALRLHPYSVNFNPQDILRIQDLLDTGGTTSLDVNWEFKWRIGGKNVFNPDL
jgi:hypothetical protein